MPAGRPDRMWRQCYGYLRRAQYRGGRPAGSIFRVAEHFRQHREYLHHRLQGHQHQLRGSRSRCDVTQPASRRWRHRLCATNHHHGGHRLRDHRRNQHGHQRRWLLRCDDADQHGRQCAGLQRGNRLHQTRRLSGQCQRQPGQRRRILPDGCFGRPDHRQSGRQRASGSAVSEQFCSGAGHYVDTIRAQPSHHPVDHRELHRGDRQHLGGGRARSR